MAQVGLARLASALVGESMSSIQQNAAPERDDGREFDVIVVGAGFAGMYLLHRLRGMGLTARVYEAGTSVGGTWYWNRYPGARCDAESLAYSYSFSRELEQQWDWSERYATQPEILRYAEHVAARAEMLNGLGVIGAGFHRDFTSTGIAGC